MSDAHTLMDRMYRYQRHIYDLTRKFYLFGRDSLIATLPIKPSEKVCEVGCGTARNLVLLAKRHPNTRFFGIDASEEMLKTAEVNIARSQFSQTIQVKAALAQDFSLSTFGDEGLFDRLVYSYSLSMMDDWQAAVDHGLGQLKPGATLHIVDFGDQSGLPQWFKKLLGRWLGLFHVRFRPEVRAYFEKLASEGSGTMTYQEHMRGYAYLLNFKKKS